MGHDAFVLEMVGAQIGEALGVFMLGREGLEVAGQACVHGLAPTMNDTCLGEERRDQPEEQEVFRHLVGDASRLAGFGRQAGKRCEVFAGQTGITDWDERFAGDASRAADDDVVDAEVKEVKKG